MSIRPEALQIIPTDHAPDRPGRVVADYTPDLIDVGDHHLCPGCGEPIAMRSLMEVISESALADKSIVTFGIGCYTAFSNNLDVEVVQALHGRAPSVATGIKRSMPDLACFSIQGDGDMVNEGLQEILHTAARGEAVTAILLNNGVFGETGGHMTATTVLGQRTKNSLEGRSAHQHGEPIRIADLIALLDGAAFVARGAVNSAGNVANVKRMLQRATDVQTKHGGFSFIEILTMCPTGWFIPTEEAPDYLQQVLASVYVPGIIKDVYADQ